jgi:hypothetical protein
MAVDQRYCLECGERRTPISSVLLGGPPTQREPEPPSRALAPPAQGPPSPPDGVWRGGTLTVIAGVGVLLLAMGVGVLIGRSGSSKSTGAPAQVISVATGPSASTTPAAAGETAFTGNWPSGTSGYTVQLQTLSGSGTAVSAIEAAKTAASAKGAKSVGALRSEDFSSLTAGHYVIYAGVYHKKAEADKALSGLNKSFPSASVIRVSNGGSSSGSGSAGASGGGGNLSKPAPPSVLPSPGKKGKSYEQESKNLPNVVSTG